MRTLILAGAAASWARTRTRLTWKKGAMKAPLPGGEQMLFHGIEHGPGLSVAERRFVSTVVVAIVGCKSH